MRQNNKSKKLQNFISPDCRETIVHLRNILRWGEINIISHIIGTVNNYTKLISYFLR